MVTLQACTVYGMETCLFGVHGDTQKNIKRPPKIQLTYFYVVINVYYHVHINQLI